MDDVPDRNDLRDLHVGMPVAEIPAEGYANLRCAAEPNTQIAIWSDYPRCKADSQDRHAIHFEFDESTNVLGPLDDKYRGTMVGGHPVILTLLISEDSRVVGLDVETDSHTRLYLRKKAYMLGRQAMSYYGEDGWICQRGTPTPKEEPIGRMYLHERCHKRFRSREVVVYREFYRPAGTELKDFVSATKLEIRTIN